MNYLLDGIKCAKLEVVKCQIMAQDAATRTFTASARQFADYITTIHMDDPRALFEVGTDRNPKVPWKHGGGRHGRGGRGGGGGGGGGGAKAWTETGVAKARVTDKKYAKADYNRLTPDQKQKLFRIQRDGNNATHKTNANSARIAALESLAKDKEKESDDERNLFDSSDSTSNSTNSALARQAKKRKPNP